MGKPTVANLQYPLTEHIGLRKGTQGTETSKYLEEKKCISLVVASERETAQTNSACRVGVVGSGTWELQSSQLAERYGKACHRG